MKAIYIATTNVLVREDLVKIRCDKTCLISWKDGQHVEEGKEYEVKPIPEKDWEDMGTDIAFPLHPVVEQAEQDELWREVFDMIAGGATIDDVEKHYLITKK